MVADAHLTEVQSHLSRWLVRLRLSAALAWAVRGLAGGLAAGLGLSLVARLRPLLPVSTLMLAALGLAAAGGAAAMALAYFWPRPRLSAARQFDRLFGLAERISMALELASAAPAHSGTPQWLIEQQWADAASAARAVKPAQGLPLRVARVDGGLVVLLAAALALSLY